MTLSGFGFEFIRDDRPTGRLVRSLVDEVQSPRARGYTVTWDGTDDRGMPVATGIYFYRLTATRFVHTRKTLLLK